MERTYCVTEQYVLKALKVAFCSISLSKVEANDKKDLCGIQKQKQKPLWDKGLQWDKIGEESKSIPKAVARDIPHVEEKKKETKSRNREEIKAAEEKKERKGF